MKKPDFSEYLAHFTKDGAPHSSNEENLESVYQKMNAKEKLISILQEKIIHQSTMPWTNAKATCFTECPWSSLIRHTKEYSPYGVGFKKAFLYSRHGGPVFYMRPDHFKQQKTFDKHVYPFITPFSPTYRPKHMKGAYFSTVDFSHEREWRVPHDLPFEYDNIEFVILNDHHDMATFPQNLKNAIGRDKFILMENYERIEKLWPVHIM